MTTLYIPKSDKGYSLTITATDDVGTAKNLSSFTAVKLKMWKPGTAETLIVDSACTVTDATNGICTFEITTATSLTKGIYLAELEATATGIIESLTTFVVKIKESG